MQYLILQHPGHNRVYYEAAAKMALAELSLAIRQFGSGAAETAAGSSKAHETEAGIPPAGDPQTGDPQTGDPQTGDPQTGDLQTGDPKSGDPPAGDPQTGDPQTGDPQTGEPQVLEVVGVRYLAFETAGELSAGDLELLSSLSFVFAIFRRDKTDEAALVPVATTWRPYLDDKISSILKYQGKTNELFTRMMISVALLSGQWEGKSLTGGGGEPVSAPGFDLLDPVAGKGTTLFEGLIRGMNVYGVEKDKKALHEANVYFRKYLEEARMKHQRLERRVGGSGKKDAVFLNEYSFGRSRDEFADPDLQRSLGLISGDTREVAAYFKKQRFHLLVGDLPYGIAHGNKSGGRAGTKSGSKGTTRNPSELMEQSAGAWLKVLHPGGVMAVAWNAFLVSRKRLAEVFSSAGFEVLDGSPYDQFEHMVDRAIRRDLLVARKPVK